MVYCYYQYTSAFFTYNSSDYVAFCHPELPLFLGENVLGRDPSNCTVVLAAPSVSKQHATICISVYHRRGRHGEVDIEALVWDLGSLNGTSKGHLNLTPNVRYALSECDGLVLADIPCQYVSCSADTVSSQEDFKTPVSRSLAVKARMPGASDENEIGNGTGSKKSVNTATEARVSSDLGDARKTPVRTNCLSFEQTPTQPESTLVPESDLDSDEEKGGPADRKHSAVGTYCLSLSVYHPSIHPSIHIYIIYPSICVCVCARV